MEKLSFCNLLCTFYKRNSKKKYIKHNHFKHEIEIDKPKKKPSACLINVLID